MAERILVVGDCQAPTVADLISRMTSISAHGFPINRGRSAQEELADKLCEFDLILAQPRNSESAGPLSIKELRRRHACVIPWPIVVFFGFHPDFLLGQEIGNTRSAALTYHSRIVAAAYANGVPAAEVERLFSPFIFARLGYYKEYNNSRAFLLSQAQKCGYDLSDDFHAWESSGVFMHTPNHPAIIVLCSIARRVAERAGLPLKAESIGDMEDRLGRIVQLPVYPALAKRLKLQASPLFRVRVPHGVRSFGISEYISKTYDMYQSARPSFFETPSIQRVATALSELA